MSTTQTPHHRRTGPTHNQSLGAQGEAYAEQFLLERGYRRIAKNWRCRYGELDLIMRDGRAYVAVEVKTRSGLGYGAPLEAITTSKAARLRRLLLEWARESGNRGSLLRIDAIGIVLQPGGSAPRIDHIQGIS